MSTTPSRRGLLAGLAAALLALFSPRPASAAPAPTPPLPPARPRGFGETVTLTDSASGLPEGLSINPSSGLIAGTFSSGPAGQTLTYSACLPPGLSLDGGLTSGYRPLPPTSPTTNERSELTALLSRLPGRRVLVVGDVMLDDYVWGEVRRVCPEAPVPVVEMQRRTALPGGAGNAAANVARLAGAACLAAVVGADRAADDLRTVLSRAGVDPAGLRSDPARPTTTKQRIMARNQQVLRIDAEDARTLSPPLTEALLTWVTSQLPTVDAVLLSDYGKGVVSADLASRLIASARQAGRPVVVDPKGLDYARYRGAALLKPNLAELEAFVRQPIRDEEALRRAGERLAAALPGTAVLVTRGADGMSLFASGRPSRQVAAAPVRRVYDVTGAGDTVAAVLALGLASGAALEAAVRLANVAAGLVVGKPGTAVVDREELADALVHGPVPDVTT